MNGHLFPDVPMYMVSEGDVVVFEIDNSSGDNHPMHLHGHHAVVLSRDGEPATGSPWWVDSLEVRDGETFEIAFVADNPGIWMDHCHNLSHAAEGLVAHLMYTGVESSFLVGGEPATSPSDGPAGTNWRFQDGVPAGKGRFTGYAVKLPAGYPTRMGISISSGVSEPCRPTRLIS